MIGQVSGGSLTVTDYLETSGAEVAGCVVLTAVGEIDVHSAPLLVAEMTRHAGSRAPLILDLSGVTFFNSSGVHLIDRARCDAATDRRRLALVPSPRVRHILELVEGGWGRGLEIHPGLGFDHRGLEIHPTLAAALIALQSANESARLWHAISERITEPPCRPASPLDT